MKRVLSLFITAVYLFSAASVCFAETGGAIIRNTTKGSQQRHGWAWLKDTEKGMSVMILAQHLTPGSHGVHIHNFGFCGEDGLGAGDHFNPDGASHGLLLKDGFGKAHAGDLGNIEIGSNGTGRLNVVIPGLKLASGKYSVGGRSLVIHEKEDTFGQPAGNAGGRAGCGAIFLLSEKDWQGNQR